MSDLYDRDFYEWTQEQAAALRRFAAERANTELDLENLAEEIEDMGKRDLRGLQSELETILEHLLKLQLSPASPPRGGWEETIARCRRETELILQDSPSLRRRLGGCLSAAYRAAFKAAALGLRRDGVPGTELPEASPFTLEQALDPDWWPANRHGLD